MSKTSMYLANVSQLKSTVQDTQQLGPDSRYIGEAGIAIIINPEQIRNTADLHTVLRTLEQAIYSDMNALDAGAMLPGVFHAALAADKVAP